jgi:AAA15 family ATPase/GTPase
MLERIRLTNFTAFKEIDISLSPGVNIFIGENATGKTHLLKSLYAPLAALYSEEGQKTQRISDKLVNVFLPKEKRLGRLIHRKNKSSEAVIEIWRSSEKLRLRFSNHAKDALKWNKAWKNEEIPPSTYIPVKEMLANAPKFLSLYDLYEIHFEEVYADILRKAMSPVLKGPADKTRTRLMEILQQAIDGKVVNKKEEFYLRNKQGELEFTLLAEGMRKLGLVWLLIQNGILQKGATLFWDEPEANLNPKLIKVVVEILLALHQQLGVQIFITTHSYPLLKEFDLQHKDEDLAYHALFKDTEGTILCKSVDDYRRIEPNAIAEHLDRIYDLEIERKLGGEK